MKKLICILIAVNLIVAGFFVLIKNGENTNESTGAIYVSRRKPEDIQKIEVLKKEESYIFTFDKEWICSDRGDVKLNQDKVGELLYDAAVISALEVIDSDVASTEKYGIEDEKIKVTYKDGGEFSYAFGNKIINSNRYYFYSFERNTVYAVTAQKKKALIKSLLSYRQINALKCNVDSICKIETENLKIEKTDGVFLSLAPNKAVLDKEKIKEFLIKNFFEISLENISEKPENFDRQKAREIIISDIYGTEDRFLVYLNNGECYMYIESENVSVKADKTLMNIDLGLFWDNYIFGEDIKSAKIGSPDKEYVLNANEKKILSKITAVDFVEKISDNLIASVLIEGETVREYKIYEYDLRYVIVSDDHGKYLVTAESFEDILKNVVN